MQICIKKLLTGETIPLDIQTSDTIGDVKAWLYDKVGIPPNQQHLTFAGQRLMEDARTLVSCNIKAADELVLEPTREQAQVLWGWIDDLVPDVEPDAEHILVQLMQERKSPSELADSLNRAHQHQLADIVKLMWFAPPQSQAQARLYLRLQRAEALCARRLMSIMVALYLQNEKNIQLTNDIMGPLGLSAKDLSETILDAVEQQLVSICGAAVECAGYDDLLHHVQMGATLRRGQWLAHCPVHE